MRESKYRVWRKNIKTMASNEDLKKMLKDLTDIRDIEGIFIPNNESTTLMQFTGKIDKNGVEIYEGDILEVEDIYDETVFYGIVGFSNCSFVIKEEGRSHYRWMDFECEVCGNIFENPDLWEDLNILEVIRKRQENDTGKRYTLEEVKRILDM